MRTNISIDEDLHKRATKHAEKMGRKFSRLVSDLLRAEMGLNEKSGSKVLAPGNSPARLREKRNGDKKN